MKDNRKDYWMKYKRERKENMERKENKGSVINDLNVPRKGMAQFIFLALNFIKDVKIMRERHEKRKLDFILVLYAPDWPLPAAICFKNHEIFVKAMYVENLQDKSNWDTLIIAQAQTFFDYFMGRLGVIRPIILGKMRVKGLFKILKVFWFILTILKLFKGNQTISESFFQRLLKT